MKEVQDWITVNRLYKKGVPIRQIARQLKISRNTVRKLIKLKEEPKYSRSHYETKVDKYKDDINMWYLDPLYNFNGTRIFRELIKKGYTGSIGPVYRFLNKLKDEKTKVSSKATRRVETPLGDQAQFDWSEYKVFINEKLVTVYCITMILAASRKKAIVFSKKVDGESLYEAIHELFLDLGGVTKELLIDNPKALVIHNDTGYEVDFNISALRLATFLGFEFNACAPYRARTKGKIEKPYQYIEEQFIKGNSFQSMEELNFRGKKFVAEWNNKVHGTTKRIPNEMFLEELETLLPVKKSKFIIEKLKQRKVSLDSFISVDGNKYSVPIEYVGKKVKFRIIYGYKIEVFNDNLEVIAFHEVIINKAKGIVAVDEYYGHLNNLVPKSLPEIRRQMENTFAYGKLYYEEASKRLKQPSFHAKGFLKLKELYNVETLNLILEYCLKHHIYDISDIKKVIKENYLDIIGNKISVDSNKTNSSELVRGLGYYEKLYNYEQKEGQI
ncbi:IS21 family transposase [Hathewaya massiliensis]|uniref:IS21 family transposase n=1 Tax=Hathewaya massiliensis TaxID=1964382 RepID=UPI001157D2F6|nr:IS21 family transposase [Hathewaya massiliensis]